jgi:4-hydroxy-tetrahydrodipicolinate synthase
MSIRGILPVIPTPFQDGRFHQPSFERLLEHMLPHVDGYTLLGSTGEAPSMTLDERLEVAEIALRLTPADKTVVVGATHTSIADAIAIARHAEQHGAKAVLCAAPYYFQNSSDGVLAFLRELDAKLGIDLVLYDNPAATKTTLSADAVVAWSTDLRNLATVKLTDHDMDKVATWHGAGLSVLGGDDPIAFRYLAAGVDGVMMIAPAIFPQAFRRVWTAMQDGDVRDAYSVFAAEILPFVHVFGIGDEIATTKAILADMGVFSSAEVRPPLRATSAERRALLRIGLEQAQLAGRRA